MKKDLRLTISNIIKFHPHIIFSMVFCLIKYQQTIFCYV